MGSSEASDDYYAWLGIEPDADETELRRVWRQLALRWHPDRAGADTAHIFQKFLGDEEIAEGGMASISMWVPVRGPDGTADELFTAWISVPPGATEGDVLTPSVSLLGM